MNYRMLVDHADAPPTEQALLLLGDLRATLHWLFDDGIIDDDDARLEALETRAVNAHSQDALAIALLQYAELAERHREPLAGLGGFDVKLIDEARALSATLQERSAGPIVPEIPGVQQALDLRNRVGTLLYERMQRVRAAARFVFRRHPAYIREATSDYSRKRRRAARAAQEEPVEPPASAPQAPADPGPVVAGQNPGE